MGATIMEAARYISSGLARIYSWKVLVVEIYTKYIFNNVALYSQLNTIKFKIHLNYINPDFLVLIAYLSYFREKTATKIHVILYRIKK